MAAAKDEEKIDKKWYVVHTYSGFENKAKKSLEEKIKQNGLTEFFGDILIPMENVVEMVKGEKRASKRRIFFTDPMENILASRGGPVSKPK